MAKMTGKVQIKIVDNCIIKDCAIVYNDGEFFCESDDRNLTVEKSIIKIENDVYFVRDINNRLHIKNAIISIKNTDCSNERYALAEAMFNIESSASDGDADCAFVA